MLFGEFTSNGIRGVETNDTDQRVTEAGVAREIESPNAGAGTIVATEAYTVFAGAISVKNSGSFQTPTTYVKHDGTWVIASTAYYNDTNIWKRIL